MYIHCTYVTTYNLVLERYITYNQYYIIQRDIFQFILELEYNFTVYEVLSLYRLFVSGSSLSYNKFYLL